MIRKIYFSFPKDPTVLEISSEDMSLQFETVPSYFLGIARYKDQWCSEKEQGKAMKLFIQANAEKLLEEYKEALLMGEIDKSEKEGFIKSAAIQLCYENFFEGDGWKTIGNRIYAEFDIRSDTDKVALCYVVGEDAEGYAIEELWIEEDLETIRRNIKDTLLLQRENRLLEEESDEFYDTEETKNFYEELDNQVEQILEGAAECETEIKTEANSFYFLLLRI